MDKETLVTYVRSERARGVRDGDLRTELLNKGWKDDDIHSAFSDTETALVLVAPKMLPPLRELLKKSFDELWKNIWKALLIMVVPFLAIFIFGIVSGAGMLLADTEVATLSTVFIALIFLTLVSIFFLIATIMIVRQSGSAWSLNYFEVFRSSAKDVLPLVVVAVLSSLAILGGFFLFIIPGFIACLWYAFAQIAVILDGKHGFTALVYSKELVRGRIWSIFLYYLVTTILVTIVNATIGLIPIIGIFISALTTPYLIIFSVHLYLALKKLKHPEHTEEVHSLKITRALVITSIVASIVFIFVALHFS